MLYAPERSMTPTQIEIAARAKMRKLRILDAAIRHQQNDMRLLQEKAERLKKLRRDCDILEQTISDEVQRFDSRISPMMLIKRVCAAHYGVSVVDIVSRRRDAKTALARQVVCWIARRQTTHSLPQIGRFVGKRDHTTVLHAIRKIEKIVALNDRRGEEAVKLDEEIKNKLSLSVNTGDGHDE